MMNVFLVGAGGFIGSVSRYFLSGLAYRVLGSAFPYGTLLVNLIGCFVIGICMHMVEAREMLSPATRSLVLIGFLGGFTTFSTFGYESFAFLKDGEWRMAFLNCAANVILGLLGVYLGWLLGRVVSA